MTVVVVAIVLCEDSPRWSDLGHIWEQALRSAGWSDDTELRLEVFEAWQGKLPRKELLLRSGDNGGFDAMVISGSRHSVNTVDTEDKGWIHDLEDMVRFVATTSNATRKARIVGICFGCQLVAKALGGFVERNTSNAFILKKEQLRCEQVLSLFPWAPLDATSLHVYESHGEFVSRLPEGSILLAASESCPHEMFYFPFVRTDASIDGGILGIQAHPEFQEHHMVERLLPVLQANDTLTKDQGDATLESLVSTARLDADKVLAMLRCFIADQDMEVGLDDDASLVAQLEQLKRQVAALRHSFAKALISSASGPDLAKLKKKKIRGEDTHGMWHARDFLAQERAEALLRGEGGVDSVLQTQQSKGLPRDAGHVASMLHSIRDKAVLIDRKPSQVVAHLTSNILCSRMFALTGKTSEVPHVISGEANKSIKVVKQLADGEWTQVAEKELDSPAVSIELRPRCVGSETQSSPTILIGGLDGQAVLATFHSVSGDQEECDLSFQTQGINAHRKHLTSVAWSLCGGFFATASRDYSVSVYKCDESNQVEFLQSLACSGLPEAICFVECFGCICLVVSVRDENCLQYYCVETLPSPETPRLRPGEVVKTNMNENGDNFVSFAALHLAPAPLGTAMLAVATDKSRIIVFRTGSCKQYRNLYGHNSTEYSRPRIAWSPTGEFLASNSEIDLAVHIWHVATGENVLVCEGHKQSIRDLSFFVTQTQNEQENSQAKLLTASFDKTLRVWDQVALLSKLVSESVK